MTPLESLQAKIQKLQNQADALIAKKSSAVIEKIRELMSTHGLTTADLDAHVGEKKRGPKAAAKSAVIAKPSAAKYQDPKTGAIWSGHGRAPGWIANAKDRSKFLIEGSADAVVAAGVASAKKAKTAGKKVSSSVGAAAGTGQPKGPQPAKYRDAKSGATWSGRGPAPAWLAGAKDRAKFLIASVSGVADSGAASKPKVVVAKKPAIKAAVAKKAPAKKLVGAKKVGTTTNVAAAPEAAAA
ncbi:H-NS histone family protein [Paraburkholderia sp. UCT31]|uniref:H-NS family nucleoid-associated regulatory protein n=1 Tax=Paraburkholderia sp. UCT31 TaxID=2615209 RepID=UPI0016556CD5|nr:H-NS family nucleoid-associated regulatory protein [Paraburkholderia sp. UCT31]MBC8742782.1 H-NS histone family protein [Paraburkholderia sp. UCT31]